MAYNGYCRDGKFFFESPSLDVGCGDGGFSFLRAGGAFREDFNLLIHAGNLTKFYENVDVFDSYDQKIDRPVITCTPSYSIDFGLDHKQSLLSKAALLGLYGSLVQHDANTILPFETGYLKTIFCNVLYWLDDVPLVLSEFERVLACDGKLGLMVPDVKFLECSLYAKYVEHGSRNVPQWLNLLDRGRIAGNIKHLYSSDQWESLFKKADLRVNVHRQHLSKTLLQIWDIGLRPLFPPLFKMAYRLPPDERIAVKREWVETLMKFALPFLQDEQRRCQSEFTGFHFYILEKES